jgi:dihydrofolate synthase/folylpolyglutamate synthase
MGYDEAVAWLYDLQYFGVKLGLDNTLALLDSLDNPQKRYRSVHVAGTNGKGSVCAFISSILSETGYKAGRYTSPHLSEFGERIAIDDFPMTREEVIRGIGMVRGRVEDMAEKGRGQCTFFETATAMAFDHFARRKVDFAIVEVGMGGRLDSTNVLRPDVAVITNVSKEHTQHLGRSIEKIAREKAGIIKQGVPTVCGSPDKAVLKVVKEKCREVGSELLAVGELVNIKCNQQSVFGSTLDITYNGREMKSVRTRMAGRHQLDNIAAAVLAVDSLKGVRVTDDDVRRGIKNTAWPARLQVVRTSPLVMLDSTHNPGGARTLATFLKEHFADRKPIGIIGMLEDKDAAALAKELDGCFSELFVTEPDYRRRMPAKELASHFSGSVSLAENVGKAVDSALKKKKPLMITGSIFTASDAVAHLDSLRISDIMKELAEAYSVGAYPGGTPREERPPEIAETEPFRVLITTILSQRTRDENTRVAAKKLFARFKTPKELAGASPSDLEPLIKSAGFPRQKAGKIIETAKVIHEKHGSKVPDDIGELVKLPGVGRKTANCVLAYGFGIPAIAVDTHVHRMTNLWGLARTRDPDHTEEALTRLIPKKYWLDVNRLMVRHGQSICNPARPKCGECRISHMCDHGIYKINK